MKISLILAIFGLLLSLNGKAQYDIIPKPSNLRPAEGKFEVYENTKIFVPKGQPELRAIAEMLVNQLNTAAGYKLQVQELKAGANQNTPNTITFSLKKLMDKNVSDESYRLIVQKKMVQIAATTPKGAFYGLQSLLQLFPPAIYSPLKVDAVKWTAPTCEIIDNPRFAYRGLMLDVGRHFFPVSFIKKYIDLIALHKMNQFHWHLTDDQGWRIEIKKYPKLTEIGSNRKETMLGHYSDNKYDGTPYGGFYTQEEIKEVVAYAQTKYVNVIPEIEMPGHALAALASYPELGCSGGPYEVGKHWGVFDEVYCPTEKTFSFLEDVLTEVIALFPSTYIHIGGDECPKTTWKNSQFCQDLMKKEGLKTEHELQSYFIKRIDKFLTLKGKKMIGWDEILEGGLSPNATVMSWRGTQGGIQAAKEKHDVVMTPTSNLYLDYYQAEASQEPLAIGGFLPIEKVYGYDPMPKDLTPEEAKHILGVQANLWTEYISTGDYAEYMAYPRACALAEIAWLQNEQKNFDDFAKRLKTHQERLKYLGVNYFPKTLYNVTTKTSSSKASTMIVELQALDSQSVVRYTTDGKEPDAQSAIYQKPIVLTSKYNPVKAASFSKEGKQLGNTFMKEYFLSKATNKKYTLKNPNFAMLNGGSDYGLTNTTKGDLKKFETWVGFVGKDLDVTLDLETETEIGRVSLEFLRNNQMGVYLPSNFEVSISSDGKNFESVNKIEVDASPNAESIVQNIGVGTGKVKARYIRIFAKNIGKIPAGQANAGNGAMLLADEIMIE